MIESVLRDHPVTGAAGSLVKGGDGILRLTAANRYGGDTRVLGGTLVLEQSSLADGASVHLAAGAVLDVAHGQADTVNGLTLGGVCMPAGSYHAGNTATVSGSGSLLVTAGPPPGTYDAWINSHFSGATDPAILGPGADPNGDGVANGLTYLFGGDPGNGNPQPLLPAATMMSNPGPPVPDGDYFVVAYRRDPTASVVSWVESSVALDGPWTPAVDGIDGVVATTTPDGFAPGVDRVSVHIPSHEPRLFVRVGAAPL